MQLPALSSAFVSVALVAFATLLPAQRGPLPGLPMTAPPVNHPALLAQPTPPSQRPTAAPTPVQPQPMPPKPPEPPAETRGVQKSGKDLKQAVAAVTKLNWHDSLAEARLQGGAHGKPILLLQALGDLEGFA
jgi:hypothetical protein